MHVRELVEPKLSSFLWLRLEGFHLFTPWPERTSIISSTLRISFLRFDRPRFIAYSTS